MAIVLDILSREELLKRNEIRKINENKFIPIYVIDNMCINFVPVSNDEGFNEIIYFY